METRKVAAITGDGKFTVVEEPIPELKKGQVLVDVKCSLISPGTELSAVPARRKNPIKDMKPGKFGYSNAGVVVKQGAGCEDIALGTPVACMGAGYALHTSKACIPRNLLVPIPEGMDFEVAAFAHLGATALHAIHRAGLEYGEHFAVLGLGIIGQCAVQMGNYSGCHVAGLDRLPRRLDLAKKNGAELTVNAGELKEEELVKKVMEFTRGYGLDCALLAFGGDFGKAMGQVQKMMKKAPDTHLMGRVVIVGLGTVNLEWLPTAFGNLDIRPSSRPGAGYHDELYEHGRDYPPVFVPWTNKRNMEEVLRMTALGKLDLRSLITHRLTLDTFTEGAEALVSAPNEALGVIVNY